jgi:Holliday junction resolvase
VLESCKDIGKYEEPLLKALEGYFAKQGYAVITHVRLNVAWSNVISDIDVLAIKGNETIIVEVKSDHDVFYRAFAQLNKLKGFADKFYIATNRPIGSIKEEKWLHKSIGLISIGNQVEIVRSAEKITIIPPDGALSQLRKKCLVKLAVYFGIPAYLSKNEIEKRLQEVDISQLKCVVKEAVLCESNCLDDCILERCLNTSCGNNKDIKSSARV